MTDIGRGAFNWSNYYESVVSASPVCELHIPMSLTTAPVAQSVNDQLVRPIYRTSEGSSTQDAMQHRAF